MLESREIWLIENRTIIKEVTGFQRLAIFRLLLATEMMLEMMAN